MQHCESQKICDIFFRLAHRVDCHFIVLLLVSLNSTRVELEKIGKERKMFERRRVGKKISRVVLFEKGLWGKGEKKITVSFFFIILSVSLFAVCLSSNVAFRPAAPPPPPHQVQAGERKRERTGEGRGGAELSSKQPELNKLEWFQELQFEMRNQRPLYYLILT